MMPLCTTATSPDRWGCAFVSVGRPWVAQRVWPRPRGAGKGLLSDQFLELAEFAFLAADMDLALVKDRQAGRIVTPVFETLQAVHQNFDHVPLTDITNDSAHKFTLLHSY